LFTLIEFTLLFVAPFLLLALASSSSWPLTDARAINKKQNKQKSPPLYRELINMIHKQGMKDGFGAENSSRLAINSPAQEKQTN
jgi:hypothetical protein